MDLIGTHSACALAEFNGRVFRVTCCEQGSRIPLSNLLALPRHVEIVSQGLSLIDTRVSFPAMLNGVPPEETVTTTVAAPAV